MKRIITIIIVVILAVGLGYFLFRISPQETEKSDDNLNLSDIEQLSGPSEIGSDDYVLGLPEAKNTLIVYEDFQCPACATFEPILKQAQKELTDTKLVFRHFLLTNIHPNAAVSALAAEAAGAQGKFWEYGSELYARREEWVNLSNPLEKFTEIASAVGVQDIEQFKADIESVKYRDKIEQDLKESLGLNLRGTPSLIFNGHELELGSVEQIKQQVEQFYLK